MNSETKRNGISVSLKDMLLYVLMGWRVLIAGLVVGAVLLGAFSGHKSLRGKDVMSFRERALEIESNLSPAKKATAENYAKTMIRSMYDYEFWAEYNSKSVFQAINPKMVIERALVYYVDNSSSGQRDSAELSSIISAYRTGLFGDILAENVAAQYGISKEDSFYYYDGVVDVSNKLLEAEDVIEPVDEGTLLIWIYNEDKAYIDSMQSAIEKTIDELSADISKKVGKHTITLANASDNIQSDNYVYMKQNKNAENMRTILKDINALKEELDSDVFTYSEYIVMNNYSGDYFNIAFDDIVESNQSAKFSISKKYVLVGAILGIIAVAVVLIIIYLAKGRVRSYDDIEYSYGISVLGTYDDPKAAAKRHKTGLDKLIRRMRIKRNSQDEESSVALISKKLELLAKNNQIDNICIAVGPDCDIDDSFLNKVIERTTSVKITAGKDILRNAQAIEAICSAQGVVLLEQVDKSTFAKIDEECQMCRGNNINILGVIVAE